MSILLMVKQPNLTEFGNLKIQSLGRDNTKLNMKLNKEPNKRFLFFVYLVHFLALYEEFLCARFTLSRTSMVFILLAL